MADLFGRRVIVNVSAEMVLAKDGCHTMAEAESEAVKALERFYFENVEAQGDFLDG